MMAREFEEKRDLNSEFDMSILRDRLIFSVPLQKLYEKIYFEQWDLVSAMRPYD